MAAYLRVRPGASGGFSVQNIPSIAHFNASVPSLEDIQAENKIAP